jgi:hypothetical protein
MELKVMNSRGKTLILLHLAKAEFSRDATLINIICRN